MGAFLRTRACAHIYMAYISYKNYILLYSHGLPVHRKSICLYIKQRRMRRSANLLYFFVVPVLFFSLRKFRKQNRYK